MCPVIIISCSGKGRPAPENGADPANFLEQGREALGFEGLASILSACCGSICTSIITPSAPAASSGERDRFDEGVLACCMARIHDDRQIAKAASHRGHGADIEIETGVIFERPDSALAEHDIGVSICQYILPQPSETP